MKRKLEEAMFPGRKFPHDFDKIYYIDRHIDKKDIDISKWKALTNHQKKYYIDKGYLNFALQIEDLDENLEDIDINEAEAKANFAFTNIPTQDMYPDRTKYTKIGKSISAQMLKDAHIRFYLPHRDQLVGAIAMSYPYDYYLYERDFPPEDLGPNEEYIDTYPPLNYDLPTKLTKNE